jgi:signal transduction histidine kinase
MAKTHRPTAIAFGSLLGLGALAVAVVVMAVGFSAASQQRIEIAARDAAAVDLLEQRHTIGGLLAVEQAAAVVDHIVGGGELLTPPITAQRTTALEQAMMVARDIATAGGSVGNEAQRWLAALGATIDPISVPAGLPRFIAYHDVATVACCAGIVASEPHHSATMRDLEETAALSHAVWDYFYIAAEIASRTPPALPPEVNRFLDHIGTPTGLASNVELPSELLAADYGPLLAGSGVPTEAISAVRNGEAFALLDQVVLSASGRSSVPITIADAFVAADAAYLSLDELFGAAVAATRLQLEERVDAAEQTRLLTIVLAPIALLILTGIGGLVYHSARQRERTRQRERELLDARNRFMRMVSHELRTPTTAISGFAQMLASDWKSLTDAEINEFLSIVDRQATHLSLLVEDLLTLSHLETGRLRLHLGTVSLAASAAAAIDQVAGRYEAAIDIDIEEEAAVLADRDRLIQILRILTENAAKYGKTDVTISAEQRGSRSRVVVADTGPGVAAEAAGELFRFWSRDGREGSRGRGYGMGLAIARHLARAMVGDLHYESNLPMGNRFVLTLPTAAPGADPPVATPGSAEDDVSAKRSLARPA